MKRIRSHQASKIPLLLLAVFLAYAGALIHAYGHDLGTAQAKTCGVCAGAGQLASACIDTLQTEDLRSFHIRPISGNGSQTATGGEISVRPRGPPALL